MTVLGHGLIFQPVLTSLPYTQACSYENDTVKTLEGGGGGGVNITDLSTKL